MLLRFSGLLALALLALAGCGDHTTIAIDGGVADASASGATGHILIEGATTFALTPYARAELVARWVDPEGRPVEGRDVTFVLEGMPRDSTLLSLGDRTDAAGQVRGTVVAGGDTATFRVRVSGMGATPAYVDVAVSADGFGELVVAVEGGDRRDIAQRVVMLHQSMPAQGEVTCADALTRREGDRARTTDEDGFATFPTLPATPRFTIVARALSSANVIVGEGCVDGVAIGAGAVTRETITLVPRTLGVEGEYGTEVALEMADATRLATEAMSLALEASVLAAGGDESLLLDALETSLVSRGESAAAQRLASERDRAEDALEDALDGAGASPTRALRSALDLVVQLHDDVRIEGTLVVAGSMSGAVASFTRADVVLGAAWSALRVDLTAQQVAARAPSRVAWNDEDDVLAIDAMPIALPLGTLVLASMDAVARAEGLERAASWVAAHAGCDALESVVESDDVLASACGASCVRDVCEAVATQGLAWLAAAAAPFDVLRARIVLSGEVHGEDANGDLAVDALRADRLGGAWTSADGTAVESLSASFGGERVTPLR